MLRSVCRFVFARGETASSPLECEGFVALRSTKTEDPQDWSEKKQASGEAGRVLSCVHTGALGRRGAPRRHRVRRAVQCGNGAPVLRVAQSTDFPNGYGWLEGRFGEISRSTYR